MIFIKRLDYKLGAKWLGYQEFSIDCSLVGFWRLGGGGGVVDDDVCGSEYS